MDALSFEEFVRLLGQGVDLSGEPEPEWIKGVSIDTRTLVKGDVFFAIKGERFDGHDFLEVATSSGAVAAVVRRNWTAGKGKEVPKVIIRAEEPLEILQALARRYRGRFNIPVIGLTGSNGKTTTKEMIGCVLEKKYSVAKTPGNLNNHIGTPLSILEINSETEIAIIEMGMNHAGEIAQLCDIAVPNHGLITNIGSGHIGFFDSVKDVAMAKSELFQSLKSGDTAFINADDPWVRQMTVSVKNQITYGLQPSLNMSGEILDCDNRGCFRIRLQGSHNVQLRVPGRHQVHNALAAAAVGRHFSLSLDDIVHSLESFSSISKRMELVELRGTLFIMDAYNSNPESLEAAFQTAAFLAEKRKASILAIIGDMLELGKHSSDLHHKAGLSAARLGIEKLFLFGPESVAIGRGFKDGGGEWVRHFENKKAMAHSLREQIRSGDVVLIKGSRGMKMEEVFQTLQNPKKS